MVRDARRGLEVRRSYATVFIESVLRVEYCEVGAGEDLRMVGDLRDGNQQAAKVKKKLLHDNRT
jgi:hypothetical protein